MKRIRYFDSLRFFAIFVVYITHFIDSFHDAYFELWDAFPTSLLLNGVTGKLGVALFGVILGYFACLSKDENGTRYILKRFSFFVIGGLIVNSLYGLAGLFLPGYPRIGIGKILMESLTIDNDIFSTYWCIPVFFAASVISYLNGKARISALGILLEIAVFYKLQCFWLAVCLMGNLVARFQLGSHPDFLGRRIVRIFLWCVIFFAIKRPEGNLTYMIDGICCTVMLMLIMRGTLVQRILDNRLLSELGKKSMGIYILHPLCYAVTAPVFFEAFSFMPYSISFMIAMAGCFAVIAALSVPIMVLIDAGTKTADRIIVKMQQLWDEKTGRTQVG